MKLPDTLRSEAIQYVGGCIRRGGTFLDAVSEDMMPKSGNPLEHISGYVADLYDNGTCRQWVAFRSACERYAAEI